MFNLFGIKKNICDDNKIDVYDKKINMVNMNEEKTLGDLAKSGHTFFRFSQSQPGRSVENVFAEYIPGEITKAR